MEQYSSDLMSCSRLFMNFGHCIAVTTSERHDCLISSASRLCNQRLVKAYNKEHVKAVHYWSFVREPLAGKFPHKTVTWKEIHRPKKVLGHSLLLGLHDNHQIWKAIFRQQNVVAWWKFAWMYPISPSLRESLCLKYNRYNIHIYYMTRRSNFIHVSIECAFKNFFNGKREVISFKFDSGYHGGNDLR